jgi:HEAT repeat protein
MNMGREVPGFISGAAPDVGMLLEMARSPEDRVRRRTATRLGLERDPRAVPALVELLSDPRKGVQEAACEALRQRGDPSVAEALSRLLGSHDLGLRNRAGTVLAGLGELSVPVLEQGAASPEPSVRKFALELMGEIRSPRVVPTLVSRLRDPDVNVGFAAAEVLGRFPGTDAAGHLMDVFRERPELRCVAAESLGRQRDPRAVPLLLEALGESDLLVRFSAVNALGQIGYAGALRPLMGAYHDAPGPLRQAIVRAVSRLTESSHGSGPAPQELEAMVPDLLDAAGSEEWEIRHAALRVLSLCPASDPVAAGFAVALDDPADEVRSLARRVMERLPDEYLPHLLRAAAEGSLDSRCQAIELLGARSGRLCADALAALLRSPEERVRGAAALALGQAGGEEDGPALRTALNDPVPEVRSCAAGALGWLRAVDAVEALRALLDDDVAGVRESALGALVLIAGDGVVRGLSRDLRHAMPERQRLAALGLGYIGDQGVLESLLEALAHPQTAIRVTAAVSLGKLQDSRAIQPLLGALQDPEPDVRKGAISALAAVGLGEVFGSLSAMLDDPEPWVRYHVVATLSGVNHPGVPALLGRALCDPAQQVAVAAVESLGRLGLQEAIGPLIQVLDRPEPELVREAIRALARTGGQQVRVAVDRLRARSPEWQEEVDRASSFP